jgi:hypothetical protein
MARGGGVRASPVPVEAGSLQVNAEVEIIWSIE